MTVIRCTPSEHEFTIKYQGKTYYGEYKKIQNVVKQVGISSPIMHYPYVCKEEGCNIRFMFHADISEHYILHHNISNPKIEFKKLIFPSHRYTPEARKNDGYFTLDELMNFSQEDFKKHNVFFNRKSKLSPCNDSLCFVKKKKTVPDIEKIENLLHDFASTDDTECEPEKPNVLSPFEDKPLLISKTETNDIDIKNKKLSNEETMVIDLTKAPDDTESDDGIECLDGHFESKGKTGFHNMNYSELRTSNTKMSPLGISNITMGNLDSRVSNVHLKNSTQSKEIISSTIDKRTPERPSRPTPLRALRNSPILQTRNSILEKSRSPKNFSSGTTNESKKGSPLQCHKYNTQTAGCLQQNLKSKDQTPRDEKDVFRKVTQILHENAPKKAVGTTQNYDADNINNTSNFSTLKEQNVKQANGASYFLHKVACHDQPSLEQNTNVPSSTNYTHMIKSNGPSKQMDGIYCCIFSGDCNFITKYRISYEKHLTEHANIKAIFRCCSCPLIFQTENSFIEHRTKYCTKSVRLVKSLLHPNISPHQEFLNLADYYNLIMCRYSEICSFVCNKIEELKYHIQELHGNNPTLYNCPKCNALFKDKVSLAIHSRNYCWKTMEIQISEGKLMHCNAESCDFSSYSVPEWHIHLASHLYIGGRTPYECSKCYIYLATKTAEIEHEKYFCPIIKPKFVDPSIK
uniref:C2H2-type domain-containing protein n=1 Tax=Strongyloides stercoralis TaxID=6248 RepID=A0A0K0E2R8_STRER